LLFCLSSQPETKYELTCSKAVDKKKQQDDDGDDEHVHEEQLGVEAFIELDDLDVE